MIETHFEATHAAVGAVVLLFGIARLHTSPKMWSPNRRDFWNPLRRYVWPPIDRAAASVPYLYAKTSVTDGEVIVTGLGLTIEELAADLEAAGYEAQPLSSIARLDVDGAPGDGELERLSAARYYGDRVGEGILPAPVLDALPEWAVRKRQIHVRPFGPDGDLTVTAHDEYNPWCVPYALPHFFGTTLNAERGVAIAAVDLGLEEYVDVDAGAVDGAAEVIAA